MSSLRLVLAWVCDPAFGKIHLPARDQDARYWNALDRRVEQADRLREQVRQESGATIRFTWLVRCDGHIAGLHGDPAWCLSRFSSTWSRLEAEGDGVGWIFYPAVEERRGWTQIYADGTRPIELMAEAGGAYIMARGVPGALLMGWHGHTQATIKRAAELGVATDLSAIPGWYTISRRGAVPRIRACDWEITPNAPYYPSAADYRRPVVYPNEAAQEILELPWTLGPANWRRLPETLVDLLRPGSLGIRRNYRRHRRGAPVRLEASLWEFRRLVSPTLEKAESEGATLTILCRVGALAPDGSRFRLRVLEQNLAWLAGECRVRGLSFEGLTARELRKAPAADDLSRPTLPEQHGDHQHTTHQH